MLTCTQQVTHPLASYRDELEDWLWKALQETLFSNRSFIRPVDLGHIAAAHTETFLAFLENRDTSVAREDGAVRANEGLGEQAALRMGAALRRFCHAHTDGALLATNLAATDDYTSSFLEGFISTHKDIVLAEQERIRAALQRALSRYTIQLQTAAEVASATSSILDPDRLLAFSVDLIRERFGFYYVGLFLLDESGERAVLRAGAGQRTRETLRQGQALQVGGGSVVGSCIAGGKTQIISDVSANGQHSDAAILPKTRSAVALPLISRGDVIGAMIIQSSRLDAFGDQDVIGLQTLAVQLANAIENARLYTAAQQEIAERRRAETALEYLNQRLSALLEVAAGMETTAQPGELPGRLVSALARQLGYDLVTLLELKEGAPQSAWRATGDALDMLQLSVLDQITSEKALLERPLPKRVMQTGEPAFVPDMQQEGSDCALPGVCSEICCSLQDASGLTGFLDVVSFEPLGEADFAVVQAAARLAATALTNAELYEQIQQQAAGLEERVAQRTAELGAVNKELEAFAYSVSHDLRSPLRSIDGFSQALLEDYGHLLDEMGQDYLHRVRAASQRMGQLIDDLLKLSRITRGEIHHQRVDLSALAQEVATELQRRDPEREVEFVIAPGLVTRADARLLRVVLENLFENAWKFTSKHARAKIELGVTRIEGQTTYFVTDDGAGFDMSYADRLFGPFQRLHTAGEFQGDGIGLATVQRIISRHGGHIWAEGALEEGAVFYFTL
jgi:signal transduction histidine kinase/putative methionine-R-sulfoxide reductase with GAF domain